MSQGDSSSITTQQQEEIFSTSEEHQQQQPFHRILVTKCSSSPPRSRSQSAGSAHKEALLFFERHQLFQGNDDEFHDQKEDLKHHPQDLPQEEVENLLIRKRSARGRSHSQPSQVLLCVTSASTPNKSGRTGSSGGGAHNYKSASSGGSGSGELCGSKRREKKCSSWLEQIEFTAQYQHYRTNDYSSVVNSASSLDKAEGSPHRIENSEREGQITGPSIGSSRSKQDCAAPPTKRNNCGGPPLCFHFPRVKLPRIFNTKSLDDILGGNNTKQSSSSSRNNKSHQQKLLSSTTSSSTSPHPTNLEIDLDSNSSVGITTPGITNTTGGTTVTEGFTTTSGYFSDLDRRESCDLLVVDHELEFGDDHDEEIRRRHSSLVSYCEIKVGTAESGKGESKEFYGSNSLQTISPQPPLQDIASTPIIIKGKSGRKWSGSSLQKSTSSITSALLLRIPPFSSDKKKSPKVSQPNNKKQSKAISIKKPGRSLSSGSLNRVSTLCANPSPNGISSIAKTPPTNTNINPIANKKHITNSDNYLNRFVNSASVRFFSVGGKSAEASTTCTTIFQSSNNKNKTSKTKSQENNRNGRSSISSGNSVSGFCTEAPSTQRKWTAVKQKWDLKLQLPPQQESSDTKNQPEESQRLIFIKSQIGQLVEAQARQRSLEQSSSPKCEVRPHEPGRVSFRLEPEEIPDSSILKGSSSFNSTTTNTANDNDSSNCSPCISRSASSDCKPREIFSPTCREDYSSAEEEMTKSQSHHHFHYASNKKQQGPNRRNNNQHQGLLDNAATNSAATNSTNKEKVHLVVANLSFLQRPTSPCLFVQSGTLSTPTLSPGVFPSSSRGVCGAIDASKVPQTSKPSTRNINEAKLIDENINVGGGRRGCGIFSPSCLTYNRDDVLSPTSNLSNKKKESEGAKKSLYGRDDSCSLNKKKGDTFLSRGAISSKRDGGDKRSLQNQSQSQFGQGVGDLDYSDSNTSRYINPNRVNSVETTRKGDQKVKAKEIDKMGDLQSPTYVKRTAHMFNSIYSSQNGPPPTPVGVGEHNSSYLNISKSVSGYSCLSYNNNSTTTNGTTTTNGVSTSKTTTKLSNGASSSTSSTSPYSHRFINGGASKPSSTSTGTSNRSEFRIKVNQNLEQVGSHSQSRTLALSPTRSNKLTPNADQEEEDDQLDTTSSYVPSHGKSFIMQRIERLYGSEAHTSISSSSGILTKKSTNPSGTGGSVTTIKFETLHTHHPRGKEIVIPIQVEKENQEFSSGIQLVPKEGRMALDQPQPEEIDSGIMMMEPVKTMTKTKVEITDTKDGNYFLQEMNNTVKELTRLCDKTSPELETLDPQSERAGNILATVGKSNLLIKKKFKQFEGLCHANLRGVTSDEPATTNEDLEGFWDMVMIQVHQVYSLFKDIEENNSGDSSVPVLPKTSGSPRKNASTNKVVKPTASNSQTSAAAKARDESRRKLLAEKRRQMKDQTQSDQGTNAQEEVVIFSPENN